MRIQAQEEPAHAMEFFEHIVRRGGRVALGAIEAPPAEWDSPLAVFEATCAHEQKVTAMIHGLVELATAERDHAASAFLQWFVSEQVEEDASAGEIRRQLEMTGGAPGSLLMLDRALGKARSGLGARASGGWGRGEVW